MYIYICIYIYVYIYIYICIAMSHIITYYVFQWSIAVSAVDLIQYLLLIFFGPFFGRNLTSWAVMICSAYNHFSDRCSWCLDFKSLSHWVSQNIDVSHLLLYLSCRHILSKPLYPKISMFIKTSTFHILIFQHVFSLSFSHVFSMQMKHVLQPRGSCGRQEGRRGDEATLTLQPEGVGGWASAAPNMNQTGIVCPSPFM